MEPDIPRFPTTMTTTTDGSTVEPNPSDVSWDKALAPYITVVVLVAGVLGGLLIVIAVIIFCKHCFKGDKSRERDSSYSERSSHRPNSFREQDAPGESLLVTYNPGATPTSSTTRIPSTADEATLVEENETTTPYASCNASLRRNGDEKKNSHHDIARHASLSLSLSDRQPSSRRVSFETESPAASPVASPASRGDRAPVLRDATRHSSFSTSRQSERTDRGDRPERIERPERADRGERSEWPERPERLERLSHHHDISAGLRSLQLPSSSRPFSRSMEMVGRDSNMLGDGRRVHSYDEDRRESREWSISSIKQSIIIKVPRRSRFETQEVLPDEVDEPPLRKNDIWMLRTTFEEEEHDQPGTVISPDEPPTPPPLEEDRRGSVTTATSLLVPHSASEHRRQSYKSLLTRRLQRQENSTENSFETSLDTEVSDSSVQPATTSFESAENTDSTGDSKSHSLQQMKGDSGYKSMENGSVDRSTNPIVVDSKTASKKRREFSRERQMVLNDSLEDDQKPMSPKYPYKTTLFSRFFRSYNVEHSYHQPSRDYSIDEKTNQIFNDFLRIDPELDDPMAVKYRRASPKTRAPRLYRKHTDPEDLSVSRPRARLSTDYRSVSDSRRTRRISSLRRLSPEDSIEEEFLQSDGVKAWDDSEMREENSKIPIIRLQGDDSSN